MLFGDRTDFAIEVEVEPNIKPPSAVWGRIVRLVSRCGVRGHQRTALRAVSLLLQV